ncbi:CAAX protease self-immunity-domain-containing protein [Tribonema minus]|uniref:CAAX protease self-immunity-domain-containing protein n=1 Tax=Tribonema minus TaxID=303371 RepID=A0A836CHD9_9STRA|nr:CAAX protease self-immunity-domain-containing protein [Tribonema minus]
MAAQPKRDDHGGAPDPRTMALSGVNNGLVRTLVQGEVAVLAVAAVIATFLNINPVAGFAPSLEGISSAIAYAIPIFVGSVVLERSNIKLFKEIDRDTQLFVVQIFGAKRSLSNILPAAAIMAASAGIAEEILFRGIIQNGLSNYIGDVPALLVASLLFGLAHNPVPGASSLVEAIYGFTFGSLYIATGGNLFAPILSHFLYDLATFVEVHFRATSRIGVAAAGVPPQPAAASQASGMAARVLQDKRVQDVIKRYGLPAPFVKNAIGVFGMLDLDKNGTLDRRELQLGVRTFGRFTNDEQLDAIYKRADLNQDGEISFDEFLKLLTDAVLQQQRLAAERK